MYKQDIFSKIPIIDYNNVLENVLEAKDFSEDVKNLLLSMVYKIENGYEDYKTIKVNTASKKFFLKKIIQIIDEQCKKIELIKPMSEQSKELEEKNVNYIVDKENGIIKVYQNERMMLEALVTLSQKEIEVEEKYKRFELAIRDILIIGNTMSNSEVIRDFNGWSWGITPSQLQNKNINVIYQNLLMLLGNSFMQKWITDNEEQEDVEIPNNEILRSKYNSNFGLTKEEIKKEQQVDYIEKIKDVLVEKCGKENTEEFIDKFLKASIAVESNINEKQKEIILKRHKEIKNELEKMQDNKKYLEGISETKKEITLKIKEIDTILSSNDLIKEEYSKRNSKLPNNKKIFSVSHLVIMLEKEREKYLEQIKINNKKMEPIEFIKNKEEFEQKNEFYDEININKEARTNESKQIENLQEIFLKCLEEIVRKAETKEEIRKILYEIRYYENIPYNDSNLSAIEKIKEPLEILEKEIVKKACREKILTTFTENGELNYRILKNVFKSKIANLANTVYVLKYHKGILKIEIYDTNIEEENTELEITEKVELSVKLNKKIKVCE